MDAVRWWWYLAALELVAGSLFSPLQISQLVFLPAAWIWPLGLWAAMGSREDRQHTEPLVLSGPHPLRRQFVAMWGVGVLIALGMSAGVMLHLVLAGVWGSPTALVIGALFVPTLALAMDSWSGTNKLFEAVYFFFWYLAAVQNVPYLDFMGRFQELIPMSKPWMYAGVTAILFGIALLGRRRQLIR